MLTIDEHLLASVTGGGAAWDAYVKTQRKAIARPYRQVVCTTAGIRGGPEMATQVYGADRTTGGDMIRASETLEGICTGGDRLPAQAPQSPF
jgi:hypothetical protein